MAKVRLNISLDKDLAQFVRVFSSENRTTVANIITQYLLGLKRHAEGQYTENILTHPAFEQAMEEVRSKLQSGAVQWHSYDEVFKD